MTSKETKNRTGGTKRKSNESNNVAKNKVDTKSSSSNDEQVIWIVFHQLEASHKCVGDFTRERRHLSHCPEQFDKKILGIFTTREAANNRAQEACAEYGLWDADEDEDEDDDEDTQNESVKKSRDFVGEGFFIDGADSGDVNTFCQRMHVERHIILKD